MRECVGFGSSVKKNKLNQVDSLVLTYLAGVVGQQRQVVTGRNILRNISRFNADRPDGLWGVRPLCCRKSIQYNLQMIKATLGMEDRCIADM